MTGNVASLIPFGTLVAFLYYVIARAEITRWFWEGWVQAPNVERGELGVPVSTRPYPFRAFLDRLLSCPMCSGFWLGLSVGWAFDLPVPWKPFQVAFGGVYGLVLCPIVIGAMHWLRHMEATEAADHARLEHMGDMGPVRGAIDDLRNLATDMGIMPAAAPEPPLRSVPDTADVLPFTPPESPKGA